MIDPKIALLLWIPIAMGAFVIRRPTEAVPVAILGAVLYLPPIIAYDWPLVPPIGRERIGILCALVGVWMFASHRVRLGRGSWVMLVPIFALAGSFMTVATNRSAVYQGVVELQGMGTTGMISFPLQFMLDYGIPFLLGFVLFRGSSSLKNLYVTLLAIALAYSVLVLWELRMSPNLHKMAFGYHQHAFGQTRRFGGWRPMVFTEHGLSLAMFLTTAWLAAGAAWKARIRLPFRLPAREVFFYFGFLVVASKSLATIVYAVVLLPVAALTRERTQTRIAALMAVVVLVYPVLRAADVFPTGALISFAEIFDKSGSLGVRFDNEELLLERARERATFGWGAWNRNRIFDPINGENLSVTDGAWIIILGVQGAVGFLGIFGMILVPVFMANRSIRRLRLKRNRQLLAGLSLICALRATDLLPNGFFMAPLTVLLSGALAGASSGLPLEERRILRARRRAAQEQTPEAVSPPPLSIPAAEPLPGLSSLLTDGGGGSSRRGAKESG